MKTHTSLIFTLMTMVYLQAQQRTDTSSFLDKTEFKIGYYGNVLWDNGLAIGTEYLWKETIKIKERKKGQKKISFDKSFLFSGYM